MPKPDDVMADWVIYSQVQDESRMNLLVYASHRDFLSAPITYTVISLQPNTGHKISQINTDFSEVADEFAEIPEIGIYHQVEDNYPVATVIVCGDSISFIDGQYISLITQVYYATSAQAALNEYLNGIKAND